MNADWHRVRGYQHFDGFCSAEFLANCEIPSFVACHSWAPLIFFEKTTKRYKKEINKTVKKPRSIMYASHRDAAVFSKYAHDITFLLENFYQCHGLGEAVIAYRRLGKANYHFAADVASFVRSHVPCCVLCFDVSKFFDTLDHAYLKARLKNLLAVESLPLDWFGVFRAVTRFSYIKKYDLEKVDDFAAIMKAGVPKRLQRLNK